MKPMLVALAALVLAPAVAAAPKEKPLKPGTVLSLESRKHARPYSLYVPKKKKSSWPLVISSHGLNGTGAKEIKQWQPLADKHEFIVACPDMCSATEGRPTATGKPKWEEDDEVLMSIFEEIDERFRVNRMAVMITGFSGGGNPSYYSGLRHPDVFTHICTRGGNFSPFQIPKDDKLREAGRERLDIYIFYGENDHELIRGTAERPGDAPEALKHLTESGYTRVKLEQIPGMGHESRARIAAEWFGEYLEKNKKRFADGEKADGLIRKAVEAMGEEKFRNAIRDLEKARAVEEKAGLPARAQPLLDEIDAVARKLVEEARRLREGGDAAGAQKMLDQVARDFRGLPAADEAKKLGEEWGK